MTLREVTATDAAAKLLGELAAEHGALRLQISGSYGVSVICLSANELRLGARDQQVGEVAGVPVTMMINEARYWADTRVVIDVIKGRSVGFSLEGPLGVHFTLRKLADPALRDWQRDARAVPLADG